LLNGTRTGDESTSVPYIRLVFGHLSGRFSHPAHEAPDFRDASADSYGILGHLLRALQSGICLPEYVVAGVGKEGEHILDRGLDDNTDRNGCHCSLAFLCDIWICLAWLAPGAGISLAASAGCPFLEHSLLDFVSQRSALSSQPLAASVISRRADARAAPSTRRAMPSKRANNPHPPIATKFGCPVAT